MAINYEKVGWDPTKFVGPTNMNHMDDGIKAACDEVDALNTAMGDADISKVGDGTAKGAILELNNNLGFIYAYYVGSGEQEFKTGDNELTVKTKIPAGVYLFIINGVHESGAGQKLPTDEYIVVNDIRERIYNGSDGLQVSMTFSTGVTDNPVIGLMLRTDHDFITHSIWHILAIRLK